MKLPYAKLLYENKKYKFTYDLKSFFSIGFVLGVNYEFVLMLLGFTLVKKI